MKLHRTWMTLTLACLWPTAGFAQLQLVADKEPQQVFGGEIRQIATVWHNDGDQIYAGKIRARILQTSSATVIPVSEAAWKTLQVLPHQTVLESARLDFPAVKAETKFLVQWLADTNRIMGKTEVLVYPTNLLAELKPLLGEDMLGVLDPNDELKPLLLQNGVAFVNLGEMVLEDFTGKLAILGPFQSKAQMREGLGRSIQILAKHQVAVVWLLPPSLIRGESEKLQPSFCSVLAGTNAAVIVQPELVADLADNPQAQLNLIYLCKQALQPKPFCLSDLTLQP